MNLQPNNAHARLDLGRNLLREGKKAEAIAQWKKAVEADPENLSAFANLVRVLSLTGSPEAAECMTKFKALQERQEATDRVRQLDNFALQPPKTITGPRRSDGWRKRSSFLGIALNSPYSGRISVVIYARMGDAVP